ncbi:MAG: Kae1-associated kinase Bud32 [Candidatus Caldarchaeum sp.]|nr:Kae1-associated kinase Bud32 [Candidatus Caldarchaeum sp.]
MEQLDFVEEKLIRVGAEAEVKAVLWKGMKLVMKNRTPKRYRNDFIDTRVRRNRTVHEAKVLTYLSENGVPVPLLFFIDLQQSIIFMQFIRGVELRNASNPTEHSEQLGKVVGVMHSLNVAHGDLTLSNIIVNDAKGLWLVDFGLSVFNAELEDKAVDLHLLERSAQSTFPSTASNFFKGFLKGYGEVLGGQTVERTLAKMKSIRMRGRYVVKP